MPEGNHKQIPIQVTVDVDEGIANMVLYLNTIPGVRTHANCQGTIGEGGPHPYRPQVLVTWANAVALYRLAVEFDISDLSNGGSWCYLHPRDGWSAPAPRKLVGVNVADEIIVDLEA